MTAVRWCPVDRLGELQRFIDEQWGRGHVLARDAELLRWQHPRPDPGELSVLIADGDGGEIAGILGIIPAGFCEHGTRRAGAWLTTWVVRPEERQRQLGLVLLRHVIDTTDGLVATLGGNKLTMGMLRALRFHVRDAVPRWVRPVSASALESLLHAAGATVPAVPPVDGEPPRASPGVEAVPFSDELAPAWDAAWSERFAPGLVGTWRDAAYLRWRYAEHPRFDYHVSLARADGGEVRGLLVSRPQRVRDRDEEVVRVVELLGDPDAQAALIVALLDRVDGERTAFIDFYCTSGRFAATLERFGFAPEDPAAPLPSLFQPLDPRRARLTGAFGAAGRDADLFAGEDVYFTRSDGDQDRPN